MSASLHYDGNTAKRGETLKQAFGKQEGDLSGLEGADVYRFDGREDQLVTLAATPKAADVLLFVYREDGQVVGYADGGLRGEEEWLVARLPAGGAY